MASFLGNYHGAATGRKQKIHRAIKSVINQTFKEWELLIIADGCNETFEIIKDVYSDNRINCILIEKQKHLSGNVRNKGIDEAKGEYIIYLDIDDYFGETHLQTLFDELLKLIGKQSFIYFNDFVWSKKEWVERVVNINKKFRHGTSNIAHAKAMNVFWETSGYYHDFDFIQKLKKHGTGIKIKTPAYYVCHIPRSYDI